MTSISRYLTSSPLAALVGLLALTTSSPGQLAPEVGYVFPAGGRAGTTVEVKLGGYDWTPDMQFLVLDQRVKLESVGPPGELLIPPPPYWFGPRSKVVALPIPREMPARFVLPKDVPPGPVRWQAANANGGTATGVFIVGHGAETIEDERGRGPQQLAVLPVTVSGRLLKNEEVDRYRFTVAKTGPVTCDLMARRLGANFFGALTVHDRDGRRVAESIDTEGLDPALTFIAQAGGEYVVSVRDIDHAGDRSYVYRLTVTPGPRVVATLPAAGRRGESRSVEFVGVGVATGAAQLESVHRQVTFPSASGSSFEYRLETPWGGAAPHTLLVSDLPETVATPIGAAKSIALVTPGAVTGVFDRAETEHRYQLNCRKGERWALSLEARRLGSSLDPTLSVLSPNGQVLTHSDDLPGTTDAGLEFTAASDGDYTVLVCETSGLETSRTAIYRLVVRRAVNDFALLATTQRVSVPIGSKATLVVKASRHGVSGPITLQVQGLPPGVRTSGSLVIPADKAELAITLEAPADAPTTAALVQVTGSATVDGQVMVRPVRAVTPGNLAPRSPEDNEITTLLVTTVLAPRFKGDAVDKDTGRKVPRGSTFPGEVTLERLAGFQGEIVLKMAARQSYQVQGITGHDVVVPPGVTRTVFPCFMPEWLETSRTSRMGMIGVAKVPDPRGTVRYAVVGIEGMITMTMEGALLKITHHGRELTAGAGQPLLVRVKVARSARLPEPVRLELRPPEELAQLLKADVLVVPPGKTEAEFRIDVDPRVTGEYTLIIRGTALQSGQFPVVSETTVPITVIR
jgi:hypothetical protein